MQISEKTICHIDINSNTSQISICKNDKLLDQTCLEIGGSYICFDPQGNVESISESGLTFFDAVAKLELIKIKQPLNQEILTLFGSLMGECLVRCISNQGSSQLIARLTLGNELKQDYKIDEVRLFGVSEESLDLAANPSWGNDMQTYLSKGILAALVHRGLPYEIIKK